MAETNEGKKAVTKENLQAAAQYIATKDYVTEQISAASLGTNVEFATNEEIVALFTGSSGGTS